MIQPKISRLLIANRGEIACRIMKTAKAMGIHCIAIYSDADRHAQHVKMADEGWYLGSSTAKESYLSISTIISIAKKSNSDAIHPGYGFLSENYKFAAAVITAGITWIGPPINAIKTMGDKIQSKTLMEKSDIPLIPGYHGERQETSVLVEEITKINFPVLLKASSGGGGKGMRVINSSSEINSAIESVKRESLSSFGNDKLLVEKFINKSRHIEVQVFLDQQGNGVYLFERDCSIQRRHQKLLEEAPAPNISQPLREQMGETALRVAKAVHYVGAGTIEFLFDGDQFYFMEMNTRLQVEHPVTEMITGIDLVEWQVRIAQGEALPLLQSELTMSGHSIEVRIYAEDTENNFLPTTGKIDQIEWPMLSSKKVRLDSGIAEGDSISPYYDPMISKLIVHGSSREHCIHRLKQALWEYKLIGVTSNIAFLRRLIALDEFVHQPIYTDFIETNATQLIAPNKSSTEHQLSALCFLLLNTSHTKNNESELNKLSSPWRKLTAFKVNQIAQETITLIDQQGHIIKAEIHYLTKTQWKIKINNEIFHIHGAMNNNVHENTNNIDNKCHLQYDVNGLWRKADIINRENKLWVYDQNGESNFQPSVYVPENSQENQSSLNAPMNGTLIKVSVSPGQTVEAGDPVLIMEAMKMEHCINAPYDGEIKSIIFNVGDLVNEGDLLAEIKPKDAELEAC